MSFGYIYRYIYSGTPLAWTPTGRYSTGRVSGAGVVASLAFLKVSYIITITSFLQFFPWLNVI